MIAPHLAVVGEDGTVPFDEIARVSAAIQWQIVRDVAPLWAVNATVSAFPTLDNVPVGYWPVIVTNRDLGSESGVHLDDVGAPYAFVAFEPSWSIAASHEAIEMIIDPYGSRTVPGSSPIADQGRVEFLVEACDPCQAAAHAYTVDDILVSDFYTSRYFDPVTTDGTRYSYTGAITAPRQILPGGYLSWHEPVTNRWWQRHVASDGTSSDRDLGVIDARAAGSSSMRERVNALTPSHLHPARGDERLVAHFRELRRRADAASASRAKRLRARLISVSSEGGDK